MKGTQQGLFGEAPKERSTTLGLDSSKKDRVPKRRKGLPGQRLLVPRVYFREKTCVCGARIRAMASPTEAFDESKVDAWLDMATAKKAGSALTAEIHLCRTGKPQCLPSK